MFYILIGTGKGYVNEDMECSHYMRNYETKGQRLPPLKSKSAKQLLNIIDTHFDTLAFCRRWLDDIGVKSYLIGLKELTDW